MMQQFYTVQLSVSTIIHYVPPNKSNNMAMRPVQTPIMQIYNTNTSSMQ